MQSRSTLPATEIDLEGGGMPLPDDVATVRAKLVYLYLWAAQRADVAEIARAVREPQIRLYPALKYLVDLGYVERSGSTFVLVAG